MNRTCPACLAPLPEVSDAPSVTCAWCGTTIPVDRLSEETEPAPGPQADTQGRIPVYDAKDRVLLRAKMPKGWRYMAGTDSSLASDALPFAVRMEMRDASKAIRYQSARTFVIRRGSGAYVQTRTELPQDFLIEQPEALLDADAAKAVGADAPTLRYFRSLDHSVQDRELTDRLAAAFAEECARADGWGESTFVNACCCKTVTRLYGFERDGRPYLLAAQMRAVVKNAGTGVAVRDVDADLGGYAQRLGHQFGAGLFGQDGQTWQDWGKSVADGLESRGGGLVDSLVDSGLLGGMIGKRVLEKRRRQAVGASEQTQGFVGDVPMQQTAAYDIPAAIAAGVDTSASQTVECTVVYVATVAAPQEEFQEVYDGVFSDFVDSVELDVELMRAFESWRAEGRRP